MTPITATTISLAQVDAQLQTADNPALAAQTTGSPSGGLDLVSASPTGGLQPATSRPIAAGAQAPSGHYRPPGLRSTPSPQWHEPSLAIATITADSAFVGQTWESAQWLSHSRSGVDGTCFIAADQGLFCCIKRNRFAVRELLATRLAARVGIVVPSNLHIELAPPPQLVKLYDRSSATPRRVNDAMLVMDIVRGAAFDDLSLNVQLVEDLEGLSVRGTQLVEQVARVCAFDCLIGNRDRFAIMGAVGYNRGNLMLETDTHEVVAIDNTLCDPRWVINPLSRRSHHSRLHILLASMRAPPLSDRAQNEVCDFVSIFPDGLKISPLWQKTQTAFIAGFRAQAAVIAQLTPAELEAIVVHSGGRRYLGDVTCDFIQNNLSIFRQYFGSSAVDNAESSLVCEGT